MMNPAIEDLLNEREAARRAVEQFAPITKPWASEAETGFNKAVARFLPWRGQDLRFVRAYCGPVCLGPGEVECQTALDYGKPILAFRKEVSSRLPEAEELLRI